MKLGFQNLRVVAFESRNSGKMRELISQHDGLAQVAPAMAEAPLEENVRAIQFGQRLLKGEISLVIFMTGVGTQTLIKVLEKNFDHQELRDAFSRVGVIARGPKPLETLRNLGISKIISISEPSTWKEVLDILDTNKSFSKLSGLTIGLQESGNPNYSLVKELKARGAIVFQVPVYRWTLPVDTKPLKKAMSDLISGNCQVALFTNSVQVSHLFQIAEQYHQRDSLRRSFSNVVTASIGPSCTKALKREQLEVDLQSAKPTMDQLVQETALHSTKLLANKRQTEQTRIKVKLKEENNLTLQQNCNHLNSSPFIRACRCQPNNFTPIWLMRQAGRYMEEYQAIRSKTSFLELCKTPDLAAEVTVTAAHRLGVDAAIIFADILLILEPMGLGVSFDGESGPSIQGLIRSHSDVSRLREVNPQESLSFVFEAVRKSRAGLQSKIPLIGFSGAPFTLASYMIEGGGVKNYRYTKGLMYRDSGAWKALMELISRSLIKYLNGQIAAGAQVVQLFDSWVGCLSPEDYKQWVLPYTRYVIENIQPGIPTIYFSTGTSGYLELIKKTGAHVISVDWRVNLVQAWSRLGRNVAIQGNMDPLVLLTTPDIVTSRAKELLDSVQGQPGHIFNLGHGILPQTPVENVIRLVEEVHENSNLSSLNN
jgi:uroporphyrinogen decarboxylase